MSNNASAKTKGRTARKKKAVPLPPSLRNKPTSPRDKPKVSNNSSARSSRATTSPRRSNNAYVRPVSPPKLRGSRSNIDLPPPVSSVGASTGERYIRPSSPRASRNRNRASSPRTRRPEATVIRSDPVKEQDIPRASSPRVSSPRASSPRASSPRVSPPRVSSPRATRVSSPRATRVSSPKVSSPKVSSPRTSSPRTSSTRASSPRTSSPRATRASSPPRTKPVRPRTAQPVDEQIKPQVSPTTVPVTRYTSPIRRPSARRR